MTDIENAILIYSGSETGVDELVKLLKNLWATLHHETDQCGEVILVSMTEPLDTFLADYFTGVDGKLSKGAIETRETNAKKLIGKETFVQYMEHCLKFFNNSKALFIVYNVHFPVEEEMFDKVIHFDADTEDRIELFKEKFNWGSLDVVDINHSLIDCDLSTRDSKQELTIIKKRHNLRLVALNIITSLISSKSI